MTSDLSSGNEIARAANAFFGGVPAASSDNDGSSEAWLAFLKEYAGQAEESERAPRVNREENAGLELVPEAAGPLCRVEPGPWRSLGGYFDYSGWADRERFLELDRAIAAGEVQVESEDECETVFLLRGVNTDGIAA
jgi:hypothetical protein